MTTPRPLEIRLKKDRRTLHVSFDNGEVVDLSAEFLRVMSPSAEVQGHSADQRQTVGGKRNVEIISLEQVGNYAIRIAFDDLHDTGIFAWPYLLDLGREHAVKWARYLGELEDKGLSRDPPAR